MGVLLVNGGHSDVWDWDAPKGHIWVHDSDIAMVVCVMSMVPIATKALQIPGG